MAITRAQQYRQMLKEGSKKPVKQAGVMNYMPSEMVTVPKIAKSSPDTPTAKLAYITPEEQDVLIDLNLYGSLDGKPNRGPGGIPSLEGDFGSPTGQGYSDNAGSYGGAEGPDVSGSKDTGTGNYQVTDQQVQDEYDKNRKKREAESKAQEKKLKEYEKSQLAKERAKDFTRAKKEDKDRKQKRFNAILSGKIKNFGLTEKELADLKAVGLYDEETGFKDPEDFGLLDSNPTSELYNLLEKDDRFSGANQYNFENSYDSGGLKGPVLSLLDPFFKKGAKKTKEFFTDDVLGAGRFKYLGKTVTPDMFKMMSPSQMDEVYGGYMSGRQSGEIDAYGNPTNLNTGGGGGDNNYVPPIIPEDDTTEEDTTVPRNLGGLAPRFAGSIFDFTGLADGGRAGAMDGGRMRQMEMMEDEDDPTGGIMDLESGRQMYFLGKLVKKATRAVKKIAKSPIGKAALMYFGGNALMGAGGGGGLSSFFGKGSFNPLKALITKGPQTGMLGSSGLGKIFGNLGLAKEGALTLGGKLGLGFGVPFALDALGVGKEEDDKMDLDEYYRTQGIDIDAIRNNPNRILARRFMAEGGDAEPVAKKTMPLLDMDGQEMDLREEGGFVPLGRMERADDVPARLSKNEFVFTADAVRNAGEGDIDKGAEVMYNMMKNLESGGEVSEESQGLDGAREMFKTSQRLEEVL